MMNNFIAVAYYTPKYKDEAFGLMCSCFESGVPIYVEKVEDKGGWDANTHYKPTFIKKCVERFQIPVLYIDADARFQKYPDWINTIDADIAYYRGKIWPGCREETLSGTLYFKANAKCSEFLSRWELECANDKTDWDQNLFAKVVDNIDIKKDILPVEYCAIFDSPYVQDKNIAILHRQASRKLRQP